MGKVLIISPYYTCPCHPHLTPYLRRLVEGLADRLAAVKITVVSTSCRERFEASSPRQNLRILRVPAIRTTRKVEDFGFRVMSLIECLSCLGAPMVVHAHWMGGALAAACLGLQLPLTYGICTVHESIRLAELSKSSNRQEDLRVRRLRKLNAIVVPSKWSKQMLNDCGFANSRVHVIPHGVDVDKQPISGSAAGSGLSVIFAKHFESLYGADLLPELIECVLQRAPRTRFHLVGDGSLRNNILERLSARARKATRSYGYLSNTDTMGLMRASDVFLTLSRFESFGVSTIEALASGCVVLASDVPTNREILEDSGFLFELTAKGFSWVADQILALEHDPVALTKAKQISIERAREFPITEMVTEHLRLYSRYLPDIQVADC